jgi:hypothetical protein
MNTLVVPLLGDVAPAAKPIERGLPGATGTAGIGGLVGNGLEQPQMIAIELRASAYLQ